MNMKKTIIMFNNQLAGQRTIGKGTLKAVEEYRYLGQTVSANPARDREINRRIGMGCTAFVKHGNIMNINLPLSLKRKVYNQCIFPVLTCGTETWHLTKEQKRKLRSAKRGMERKMLGITWRDRKRATWIGEQTKDDNIIMTIKKKWSWLGHIISRTDNKVTEWQPRNYKKRQSRQKTRRSGEAK